MVIISQFLGVRPGPRMAQLDGSDLESLLRLWSSCRLGLHLQLDPEWRFPFRLTHSVIDRPQFLAVCLPGPQFLTTKVPWGLCVLGTWQVSFPGVGDPRERAVKEERGQDGSCGLCTLISASCIDRTDRWPWHSTGGAAWERKYQERDRSVGKHSSLFWASFLFVQGSSS